MLSEFENYLIDLWCEMLNLPSKNIELDKNFFHLGGNSIIAYQIIVRLNEKYKINDTLEQMFLTPDIKTYSQHIQKTLAQGNQEKKHMRIKELQRGQVVNASPKQFSIWYLSQFNVDSTDYNRVVAKRLVGDLNIHALKNSINSIIERHDILRTSLRWEERDSCLIQYVENELSIDIFEAEALDSELPIYLTQHAKYVFDLSKGPFLKVSLIKLKKDEHILIITTHESSFDQWSLYIFYHELTELYNSFCENKVNPLPQLPIQYADYVLWLQNKNSQDGKFSDQSSYWQKKLEGAPTELKLPLDFTRPDKPNIQGSTERILLSKDLMAEIISLCSDKDVTLFMLLITCFNVLIWKIVQQKDILIGTMVSDRDDSDLEHLIGPFLNTVTLRCNIDPAMSFLSLLQNMKITVLEAYKNKDIDFSEVIKIINPKRSSNISSLIQVLFAMQNIPKFPLSLRAVKAYDIQLNTESVPYDLIVRAGETEDGLFVSIDYKTALFKDETIKRLLRQYKTLIEDIVENCDKFLCDFQIYF